jgi:hypothetical protein
MMQLVNRRERLSTEAMSMEGVQAFSVDDDRLQGQFHWAVLSRHFRLQGRGHWIRAKVSP